MTSSAVPAKGDDCEIGGTRQAVAPVEDRGRSAEVA